MSKTNIVKKINLICEPNNITVDAEFVYRRKIIVYLKLDDVLAVKYEIRTDIFPSDESDYYDTIKLFLDSYIKLKEDYLHKISESYMPALNIHRNIKKVMTRSGKLIWTRP